jgi:hypothetical protein
LQFSGRGTAILCYNRTSPLVKAFRILPNAELYLVAVTFNFENAVVE